MTPLIFVYSGKLPDYAYYALEMTKNFSKRNIILLLDKNNLKIPKKLNYYFIQNFYTYSELDFLRKKKVYFSWMSSGLKLLKDFLY